MTRMIGRAASLGLALALSGVPARATEDPQTPVPSGGETRTVIAGRAEYKRSGFFKKHFGEGYRSFWTTPFVVPILDLKTFASGLTPVRQVGSMQSLGLALKGRDGRSYTFRTVDKDPRKILPAEWAVSFPAEIFQDQTTASHPGAALMVPTLAEAAGVPHTRPRAMFMPDDPALGEFRAIFGGKAGLIDEFPAPAVGGIPGFHGATFILSTEQLWEKWRQGEAVVDTRALLRARLFDLFLGDWDRHNGQWRFMQVPGHESLVPLPEDRDQAFSNYKGLVMGLARTIMPRFVEWRADYDNIKGLVSQGREVDDWLLNGLERDAFRETALELRAALTDAVIESAVAELPSEWRALGVADFITDLKKRRDLLPQGAEAFYENLARYVNVQGTDRADLARLTREADGSAVLEISLAGEGGSPGRTYFKRRFLQDETREIRIYLYGGDDRFVSSGPRGGIPVRVAAGAGADVLDDSKSGGTSFSDVDPAKRVVRGPGSDVSSQVWTPRLHKPETPWMVKQDYDSLTPLQPLLWWEPDPGIVLSMGVTRFKYGFRKEPYSSMQHFGLEFKTRRGAFAATYVGDFRWSRPGFATLLELEADGADHYNYSGAGNETPGFDDDFTEADQKTFEAFPSLVAFENPRRTFWLAFGPEVKYSESSAPPFALISRLKPYGFGDFGQAGVRFRAQVDTRGRVLAGTGMVSGLSPGEVRKDTGFTMKLDSYLYPKGWDVTETFSTVSASMAGYWQASSRLTLAGRIGGQKVWGAYPWHESAFIGGSDTVRGYGRNRFAGDASLYGNAQAMLNLFRMNFILPMRVGVLGLAETGRVFLKGETSKTWHPAYGAGLYIRVPATGFIFHGLFSRGSEGAHFHVNVGFGL